jgi:RNA-directed DNA polymerase
MAGGERGAESLVKDTQLMEEVVTRENLQAALRQVRGHHGSAGIDGMTGEELPAYLKTHWPEIREQLLTGHYEPQPIKRVEIPKPEGGVRKLGIPMVPSYCTSIQAASGSLPFLSRPRRLVT